MGDIMKKGLYCTFNFKHTLIFMCTLVLFFSFGVIFFLSNSFVGAVKTSADNKPVIIVDAGHGGEDGGTQSAEGVLEKDINLAISLKINDFLSEQGFETVLVRDGDYMIYDESSATLREKKVSDIHNRMKIMKENENCIFLSVHQNYFTQSKYSGAQVFYSKNNPESRLIAAEIQKAIVEDIQPDNSRQIKESTTDIYLLYHAKAPAVMVECGFMSNSEEAAKLSDEEYQLKMAKSIVKGLKNYLDNKSQGEMSNGSENKKYFRMQ